MRSPLVLLLLLLTCACTADPTPRPTVTIWHTFGPEETAALNEDLAKIDLGVRFAATVVPFGRAQNRLAHALTEGKDCPDLARIDATWLPGLAAAGLLAPLEGTQGDVTPAALELARWDGQTWAIPQAVDGLAILVAEEIAAPATLDELEATARRLAVGGRKGLSVRADGYWYVAWLRAAGGDVDPATCRLGVDRPEAEAALVRMAGLVAAGIAAEPEPGGDEAAVEARRFAAGEIAMIVGGPWTVAALERAAAARGVTLRLRVLPFPRAPDGRAAAPGGGQLWVVPRCAAHPAEAWRLAAALTSPDRQAAWSHRLGIVPTRVSALAEASPLAREFAVALAATRPLARDAVTPLLFDDLTPAVQAVLAHDATAAEALAGVTRAWRRLLSDRCPP